MKTIEPSEVILKGICSLQTDKCVANQNPTTITAVWAPPGRTQVNVCVACLQEMIRTGEWEIQPQKTRKPVKEDSSHQVTERRLLQRGTHQPFDAFPAVTMMGEGPTATEMVIQGRERLLNEDSTRQVPKRRLLQKGTHQPFEEFPAAVTMRGEGPTATEMVIQGRHQ
jgi:hypothetical protein